MWHPAGRVKLARGDAPATLTTLAEMEQFVQQHQFGHLAGEIADVRIRALLHQGALAAAARLAQSHDLPISQARIHIAQGDPKAALAQLEPLRQQAEAKHWADMCLQVLLLQALAHQAADEHEQAVQAVGEALALAAPGGLLRPFVDEGAPMAALLQEAVKGSVAPLFAQQVLAAFGETSVSQLPTAQPLPDPLSDASLKCSSCSPPNSLARRLRAN